MYFYFFVHIVLILPNMNNALQVAEKLLQIHAIKLNLIEPYTWASGWRSPIYCDNRKILSYPHVRDFIKSEMSNVIMETFAEAEIIAGVATAGIPWGALIADQIKLPFIYVRSAPKSHGLGNQIEGNLEPGKKVVVIEDLISTGKSSMQVIDVLQEAGAKVLGMSAIFTYGFTDAIELFANRNIPFTALSNFESLLELASQKNMFQPDEINTLSKWRAAPNLWKQNG
jgi:orotate phosphoribosyltransferase